MLIPAFHLMQWWCSAQGVPWTWTWRPYPGVWLLVIAAAIVYYRIHRSARAVSRGRGAAAVAGIACLWLTLDWPIGALGAGYLASVHMVQFLGLALVVPPLLLAGLPEGWETRSGFPAVRPMPAIVAFTLIVYLTHLPAVVDGLMVTQLGSFGIDLAWLLGGLMFWWPVVRRWPPPGLGAAARLAYVLAGLAAHMGVGMYLSLAPYPIYQLYELAPPIGEIRALEDQLRAGSLMLFSDVLAGLLAVALLVHLWHREDRARHPRPPAPHTGS